MGPFTANQLSYMSAILARCATLRDWTTETEIKDDGIAIQEVQCMMLGTSLYIAGNHDEAGAVAAFLNAFGVNNEASFLDCLAHADWLLTMPHTSKKANTGIAYKGEYSAQEKKTLELSDAPFTALSDEKIVTAKALLKGPSTTTCDQKLGWFLRKFVGAGPLSTNPYTKAKAKNGVTIVTNALSSSEVCVLALNADVHAELKLLSFMFDCVAVSPGQWATQTATIGGLKKTCTYCACWITEFSDMLKRRVNMDVALPTGDDRAMGSGAGKRPGSAHLSKFKNDYLKAMFNGEANDRCTDLARLKPVPVTTTTTGGGATTAPTTGDGGG